MDFHVYIFQLLLTVSKILVILKVYQDGIGTLLDGATTLLEEDFYQNHGSKIMSQILQDKYFCAKFLILSISQNSMSKIAKN